MTSRVSRIRYAKVQGLNAATLQRLISLVIPRDVELIVKVPFYIVYRLLSDGMSVYEKYTFVDIIHYYICIHFNIYCVLEFIYSTVLPIHQSLYIFLSFFNIYIYLYV